MEHSSTACVRSLSRSWWVIVIVAATCAVAGLLAWGAVGAAGVSAETGGGTTVLAWLASQIEDLLMIIQDTIEGWTWA
ncbi:MAG: hypothetical protein ACTHQE_13790 [Thermomicrobiales bacterium]|jgi:hypothetical protein